MPIFPCDAVLKSVRIIIILTRELRFILLLRVLFLIIFLVFPPVFIPHLLHLIRIISIIHLRTFSRQHSADSISSASQSFRTHKIFPDYLTGFTRSVESFQYGLQWNNSNESVTWRPWVALCKTARILSQGMGSSYHALDPLTIYENNIILGTIWVPWAKYINVVVWTDFIFSLSHKQRENLK